MNDPAMTDPGKAHFIFDYSGLSLRQVIALHQQALGEIASLELQLAAWKESVDKAAIRITNLQSSIDNELCDIRLDGEAKSAEIHRLQQKCEKIPGYVAQAEAHRTLLMERDQQLKEARGDYQDFLHFIARELAQFPCCHEEGYHTHTPPMMWPELIRCIIKKASEDSYEAGRDAEKMAQHAAYWAAQKMPREPTFSDGETP